MTNISVVKGDDKDIVVNFKNGSSAMDITGATVIFTVKELQGGSTISLQKVVTSHTDSVNGQSTISIEDTDTASLDAKTYWYDIQLQTASGKKHTVVVGRINVIQGITND